jgi:hypothetical protein
MSTRGDRGPSILVRFVSCDDDLTIPGWCDDDLTIPGWAERTDVPALPGIGDRVVLGTSGPTVRVVDRTFMVGTMPRVLLYVRSVT